MNPSTVVVALLLGVAAHLLFGVNQRASRLDIARERRAAGTCSARSARAAPTKGGAEVLQTKRWAVPSCLLCAAVAWLLIGGIPGVVVAVVVAAAGPKILGRLESGAARANRLTMESSAPMVADLLAACLASGASTAVATRATAEALGGPVADVLMQSVTQFNLGASATRVWKPLADEPALAPIARAILRSAETGAPLTTVLLRVSDDLRLNRRAQLEQAAKTVGIKAVGPLGLCFLPAFMLLGVVPLIASLIATGLAN